MKGGQSSSSNNPANNKATAKKDAKAEPDAHRCFHCQTEGTGYKCCSQCKMAWYCSRSCQKLHWKHHHKRVCVAAVAAKAKRATMAREATAAREGAGSGTYDDVCVICADEPIKDPVKVGAVCVAVLLGRPRLMLRPYGAYTNG